ERNFDVLREAMEAEEPALARDAIEGRVPLHGLAHAGDGARDERVEATPDVAFPARHGRDVGLHRGVAVGLRDLRVAAGEEDRLRSDPLGGGLPCDLRRRLRRLAGHCVHAYPAVRRPLRHLAACGSMNRYRPLSRSKMSGSSAKRPTQTGGSFHPMAMMLTMTATVNAMDSHRWICRIHLFQFNGTSFIPSVPGPAPGPQRTSATRTWRPRGPASDPAGSPTAPCAGGFPCASG